MNITCQDLETQARLLAAAYAEVVALNAQLEECQAWNRQASAKLQACEEQHGTCSSEPTRAVELHGDGSDRRRAGNSV